MATGKRPGDRVLNMYDVMEITRHSRSTVKKWLVAPDGLPSFKLSDSRTAKRLVWESDLQDFLRRKAQASAPRPSRGRRRSSERPAA